MDTSVRREGKALVVAINRICCIVVWLWGEEGSWTRLGYNWSGSDAQKASCSAEGNSRIDGYIHCWHGPVLCVFLSCFCAVNLQAGMRHSSMTLAFGPCFSVWQRLYLVCTRLPTLDRSSSPSSQDCSVLGKCFWNCMSYKLVLI